MLPHLDRLDDHATLLRRSPSGKPGIVGLPKVTHGRFAAVRPRLAPQGITVASEIELVSPATTDRSDERICARKRKGSEEWSLASTTDKEGRKLNLAGPGWRG